MADATQPTDKKTLERSAAYPGYSLEEAINFTQLLRKNLGSTAFSRESASQALGHPKLNGTSTKKTAACVHFGLLTRQGNTYRQSPLADQYFNYTSDQERAEALIEAVQSPTLYGKLLSELNGRSLPGMLENVLARNYGITEKASILAAKDFRASAEYAGVLVNGVVNLAPSTVNDASEENPSTDEGRDTVETAATPAQQAASHAPSTQGMLPISIPGTDVTVLFPISYAYDLSVGTFSEGIKALESSIKSSNVVSNTDEQSDTISEE